ncbi:hypothetical protein [Gordonia sp. UCD-TK1]|uniref:hypothetical protein n=1 Tax=Gordonia sp. UCD-TK1 TaxID=1857893 RepID=UPI00080DE4E6|nr:hypothetical protein [Gordonia sp. UCD-TK1]OCH83450.1 hypothetical protein A9310_01340 [Gordonia sp. UCD-TK1]
MVDDTGSSASKRAWTYALALVSVVALAFVVVGLVLPPTDPELTTPSPASSATEHSDSAAVKTPVVVSEPVDPNAPIPGCTVVEAPDQSGYTAYTGMGQPTYDNPQFPWFNGPKATAMSTALVNALPVEAEIEFASPEQSFVFQPIIAFGEPDPEPRGFTSARGVLINGEGRGAVSVDVRRASAPVPSCVAGQLDERRTLPDGVVVDVHDTWQEVDGVRALSRTARAYVPDGSWIIARADDAIGGSRQDHSGSIPLTVDELVRIVRDPGLRVSTPVDPGTPAPMENCESSFGSYNGQSVTREQARELDAVLATVDLGSTRLPPLVPVGSPAEGMLCTGVADLGDGVALEITIVGGQPRPSGERPVPGRGSEKTQRTLLDGTVVETDVVRQSRPSTTDPRQQIRETTHSAVVTRPTGSRVSVSSTAASPTEPLSIQELETIALTPGLEL